MQALERFDAAERELESSLEWTMSLPENDRHEEYSLLTALAKVKSFRSKYREAIELYERALPLVDTNAHSPKWLAHHISSYGEILRKVKKDSNHVMNPCVTLTHHFFLALIAQVWRVEKGAGATRGSSKISRNGSRRQVRDNP